MQEKVYKADFGTQILSVIVRTIVICIASFIAVGVLQIVLSFISPFLNYKIKMFFGGYAKLEFLILIIAFIYSLVYTFSIKNVRIAIDGNILSIIRTNKVQEDYSFHNTKFFLNEKTSDLTVLGKVSSNYIMKIIDSSGYSKQICCFAFSKKTFYDLKNEITRICNEMEEKNNDDHFRN